jgi:hypothetical protein
MKLPDNLPPLPPVPPGFDRWEYRGQGWTAGKPVEFAFFPSGLTDGWRVADGPRCTNGDDGTHYLEAVRDEPAKDKPATGVEARVCADIAARQRVGIAKYGVTVEQSPDDMLRHAYEEALDLSVYLKAEIERRQTLLDQGLQDNRPSS